MTYRVVLHIEANWQLKYLTCDYFRQKATQIRMNSTEEPLMCFHENVLVLLMCRYRGALHIGANQAYRPGRVTCRGKLT